MTGNKKYYFENAKKSPKKKEFQLEDKRKEMPIEPGMIKKKHEFNWPEYQHFGNEEFPLSILEFFIPEKYKNKMKKKK